MFPGSAAQRVLICEDEGMIVLILRKILLRAGYVVVGEEADGEKAVARAQQLQPDFILMDSSLLGPLSGIEAARQILQERELPILMLSAYRDEAHVHAALDTGISVYLVKPITSEQLLSAIETALAHFDRTQFARWAVVSAPQKTL